MHAIGHICFSRIMKGGLLLPSKMKMFQCVKWEFTFFNMLHSVAFTVTTEVSININKIMQQFTTISYSSFNYCVRVSGFLFPLRKNKV